MPTAGPPWLEPPRAHMTWGTLVSPACFPETVIQPPPLTGTGLGLGATPTPGRLRAGQVALPGGCCTGHVASGGGTCCPLYGPPLC